jgi:hypothetical protein
LAAWGAEEIESDVGLGHEQIPFGEWEFGITGGEARAEKVFPSLDCALSGVATVAVRRHSLEIDLIFLEGLFEFIGAFIVEDVEIGSVAVGLEWGV